MYVLALPTVHQFLTITTKIIKTPWPHGSTMDDTSAFILLHNQHVRTSEVETTVCRESHATQLEKLVYQWPIRFGQAREFKARSLSHIVVPSANRCPTKIADIRE
jgi:hypothetical protein